MGWGRERMKENGEAGDERDHHLKVRHLVITSRDDEDQTIDSIPDRRALRVAW